MYERAGPFQSVFSRGGGYLNLVYATIPRPVSLRATPTVSGGGNLRGTTFSGGYQIKSILGATGLVNGFDNANQNSTVDGVRLTFGSNWPAGEVIISDHDGTGFIAFDAEL